MSDEIGSDIQKHLLEFLKKYTPYAKTEAGVLRFDVAAYIPEGCYVGFEHDKKLACLKRFKKNHCEIKWDALVEECEEIPKDERERLAQPLYQKDLEDRARRKETDISNLDEDDKEYAMSSALFNTPQKRLGDMTFTNTYQGNVTAGSLWNIMKDTCLCDNDMECPTAIKCQEDKITAQKRWGNYFGLHLFEVKSDKDTFTRLAHQIPLMTFFADYIWLVLGENQPIPEWLPPYVGVLRFVPPDGFKVERKGVTSIEATTEMRNRNQRPVLTPHVLFDHDCEVPFSFQDLHTLYKKWFINSIFRWDRENHDVIIDMSKELTALVTWAKSREVDACAHTRSRTL